MRAENEVTEVVAAGGLGSLAEALAKAQSKFVAVAKSKTAKVPMKSGGTYSYNYADLADIWDMIRKPLGEVGIAVLQPVATTENGVAVTTMLVHAGSGQTLSCKVAMPTFQAGAQGLGSAITYARRYGLGSMLGIVTDEDDDGALATHDAPAPARQQAPTAPAGRSSRAAQVASAIKPPAVIDVKAGETEEQASLRMDAAAPSNEPAEVIQFANTPQAPERSKATTIRFGRTKGKFLCDIDHRDLDYHLAAARKAAQDETSQYFEANQQWLATVEAEVARRGGA